MDYYKECFGKARLSWYLGSSCVSPQKYVGILTPRTLEYDSGYKVGTQVIKVR